MTTQRDDAQEREIQALVDQIWALLVDCPVEQKGEVLDRLSALLAGEEASFDPASAPGRAH